MKKKLKYIFTAVFLICCLVPVFTMPFFAQSESTEKRELSSLPVLYSSQDGLNQDYFDQLNTYLSEHFSFRSQLVTAWSVAKASVFKTSTRDNVIVGKDDWLFFADTLPDFTGSEVLDKNQLRAVVKILDLMNEYVEKNSGDFVFVVAPNKNTVYPQHMPYNIIKTKNPDNSSQLNELLKNKSYYINLLPVFEKETQQLYHKRDSHWNNRGAAICFNEVMNHLDKEHINYLNLGFTVEKSWRGDLDDMLFPSLERYDDQVVFDFVNTFEYVSTFRSPEDIKIKTYSPDGNGNLFMIRDSFTNALQPMFSQQFEDAEFSRVLPARLNTVEKNQSDTVILELAQRNIPELLNGAPVMEAPKRELSDYEEIEDAQIMQRNFSGYLHIYGILPDDENGKNIYVSVNDGETETYYEAFPVLEKELTKAESKNGFSAYLPYSASDNIEIKILKDVDLNV